MVEFRGGMVVVIMVIYFTFFIAIVDSTEQMKGQIDTRNVTELSYSSDYNLLSDGYCNSPRYEFNSERERVLSSDERTLACEVTAGVKGKEYCERLEGCYWDNATSGFWFWTTEGEATCLGNVNHTYYNMEKYELSNFIKYHNNSNFWNTDTSVCNHPTVIDNSTLCGFFSCTWSEESFDADVSYKGIKGTVGDIFTFSYDFNEDNPTMKFLLNFLFVVVPLLILLIAVYTLIPVI